MNDEITVIDKAKAARAAALTLARTSGDIKRQALEAVAAAIRTHATEILEANSLDVADAEKEVAEGKLSKALFKRLVLDQSKVEGMALGVEALAAIEDPCGRVISRLEMDEGMILEQVTCPIGVVGAVFEARPDAVPQISSLCFKAGNAVILKGGAEAARSNRVLAAVISEAACSAPGIPQGWLQLIETRADVTKVLELDQYIDLLVPRGSNAFVRYIQNNTSIPVLGHADGICHIYVDSAAEIDMAADIALDAKIQYTAACNAVETILVHKSIAADFLPRMCESFRNAGVEVRGCEATQAIVAGVVPAVDEDWATEYLDMIVSVKIVDSLEAAIAHINTYGSRHTDSIITSDAAAADEFLASVDSACVFHNASTRFSDGYRFGKGAELGISTNKTHARGPVGVEGLIIYNYRLRGSGQKVCDYVGPDARRFTHRILDSKA